MRAYFLETNRILFSHWAEEDINLANSLWENEAVTKFISKTGQFSEKEIADRLRLEINNEKQFGVQYWPVFEKGSEEFIGCCGLRPYHIEHDIYEIGSHLKPEYWGKGLGTEATRAVMQFAFDTLHVVELFAGHNPNHNRSKKVLEKLGFQYTGIEYYEPTGLYHPSYNYRK